MCEITTIPCIAHSKDAKKKKIKIKDNLKSLAQMFALMSCQKPC